MFAKIALLSMLVCGALACSRSGGSSGGCGGCRAKARGVLRLDGDSPVDADFGQVHGLALWQTPKPENASLGEVTNPDFLFKSCCSLRGLPDACVARCNYGSYNQQLLQSMLVNMDGCPFDKLPEMHFCAAQGRDHSSCCKANGVTDVAAGEKCLVFCDQRPDIYTPIDYTYTSCFEKFDTMKQCFQSTIQKKAKAYFGGKH